MNLNTDVPRTKTVLLQLKHENIVVFKHNRNHENGLGENPKWSFVYLQCYNMYFYSTINYLLLHYYKIWTVMTLLIYTA